MRDLSRLLSLTEKQRLVQLLYRNLLEGRDDLDRLLTEANRLQPKMVYGFYHRSFKIFGLQALTVEIAEQLAAIAPEGRGFCDLFAGILAAGTGRTFAMEDNARWLESAGPIVEAFFHAQFFLESAIQSADLNLDSPTLPYPCASILSLFDLR